VIDSSPPEAKLLHNNTSYYIHCKTDWVKIQCLCYRRGQTL